MTAKNPLVSIIIINWNGGSVFDECLKTLSKVSYSNWEVIVIDNGSSDASDNFPLKYSQFRKAKIIKNKINVGFASANNQGVNVAKGKYLLLLNNDTKVTVDFLSIMVTRIEADPQVAVIQPKIFLTEKPGYLDNAGSFFTKIGFLHHWGFMQKDGSEFSREREIFSAKGACMLIRKDVVEKIGLFDEDFFSYFEESDFCWRVWLFGYKVLYYPKAKIYHKLGFTIRRLDALNLNYHYYKNRICSLVKNLGKENLLPILASHLIVSLGIMMLFLIRFHPKNSFLIAKALWWNLIHLTQTLNKRREVQGIRKVNDRIIFNKLSTHLEWKKYFNDFKRIERDLR